MLNNSNLLSKFSSPSQQFHSNNPHNLSSHNVYPNKSDTTPRHDKKTNGMVYGFGIQVSKIPTQSRNRTPVRPLQYSLLNSRKKSLIPNPSSAQKSRPTETDIFRGLPKEVPKLELPKLTPIKKSSNLKNKGYSHTDINYQPKRNSLAKLKKLRSTSKEESQEREEESFMSAPIFPSDPKKDIVEIRAKEIEEYMKRNLERENSESKTLNEGKSYNIVQKRLNKNPQDSTLFDFWDARPTKKERTFGNYLQKALNEVSMNNVHNGNQSIFTNGGSPNAALSGLEIKGHSKERLKQKSSRGLNEKEAASTSVISVIDRDIEFRENKIERLKASPKNELEKYLMMPLRQSPKDKFERVKSSLNRSETEENRKMNGDKTFKFHKESSFEIQRSFSIDRSGKVHKIFKESEFVSNLKPKYNSNIIDRNKKSATRLPQENGLERNRSGRQLLDPIGTSESRRLPSNQPNNRDNNRRNHKREFESPRIEEYQYEAQSDDDLSLYDYMKAKKENTDKDEEFEYDFIPEKGKKK